MPATITFYDAEGLELYSATIDEGQEAGADIREKEPGEMVPVTPPTARSWKLTWPEAVAIDAAAARALPVR